MRKIIIAGVVGISCLTSVPAQADFISDLTSVVSSMTSQGPAYACKKANLFGGTVTLRSFSGYLCGADVRVAALTQAACPKLVTDFAGSGCDTAGKKALGTQTSTDVLKTQLSGAPTIVKTLACKASSVVPDATIKTLLSAACAA